MCVCTYCVRTEGRQAEHFVGICQVGCLQHLLTTSFAPRARGAKREAIEVLGLGRHLTEGSVELCPQLSAPLVKQRYTHAPLDVLMSTMPISSKLRDQLGMVVYPGQAGATVTRGCAGLNWLGGERMGEGRFATRLQASWGSALGSVLTVSLCGPQALQ